MRALTQHARVFVHGPLPCMRAALVLAPYLGVGARDLIYIGEERPDFFSGRARFSAVRAVCIRARTLLAVVWPLLCRERGRGSFWGGFEYYSSV